MCTYRRHSRITTNTATNTAATITARIAGTAADHFGIIGRKHHRQRHKTHGGTLTGTKSGQRYLALSR
jgi:hypothetical protein